MESRELKEGDIMQINPECPKFGGQLLVVTEPKSWGCEGRMYSDTLIEAYRSEGRAYLRINFKEMEY